MDLLSKFFLILILICLNGFFVAAEYALVTVRQTRIEELVSEKKKNAKRIKFAQEHIDRFISATQLGITVVSLAVGWLGEPIFAGYFENLLSFLPQQASLVSSHVIGVIISFVMITYMHVIIGEVVPKNIALQRAERIAFFTIVPLTFFTRVFSPFIWLLNSVSRFFLNVLGLRSVSLEEPVHSEEEVRMILTESGEGGAIPEEEVTMVNNIFELGDTPVGKIMVPKKQIVGFSATATIKDVLTRVIVSNRSRYPVYHGNMEHITGFVHIKDIYKKQLENENQTLIDAGIIRRIITVTSDKRADAVLLFMQKKRVHMAVVVDKEKKTRGIVTLEDIIEGVVGSIEDEFESENPEVHT